MSTGAVMSVRKQVLFSLFFSTMSGLLAVMVLSVWMSMSHSIVKLSFLVTVLSSCSYHRSFTSMPNSLQIFQCMCAAALLWQWMYSVLASSGQPETRWSIVSSKQPHSLHFGSTWGFLRMLCWYQRAGRIKSWAVMIKPSVPALRTAAFRHLWVFSWSSSACFTCGGYLPWSAFNSHLDLRCWQPWCLALAFVLWA